MPHQPNKPDGDFDEDGEARPAGERQAVKNQSTVTPGDYPEPASGDTTEPAKDRSR